MIDGSDDKPRPPRIWRCPRDPEGAPPVANASHVIRNRQAIDTYAPSPKHERQGRTSRMVDGSQWKEALRKRVGLVSAPPLSGCQRRLRVVEAASSVE